MITSKDMLEIRGRIAGIGLRHADVAKQMGMHESLLSAILRGRRSMPDGFKERIQAALDRLEQAEQAAREARERVLAEVE